MVDVEGSLPTVILESSWLRVRGEAEAKVSSETENKWVIRGMYMGQVPRPVILYRIHPDTYDQAKNVLRLFS